MALSARFDKHTHPRLLKEKTKTITNLASPALKAKVPECARDSGKTWYENVTNQRCVTGESANQWKMRMDENQSYRDSLLKRTPKGWGRVHTRMLVQEREMWARCGVKVRVEEVKGEEGTTFVFFFSIK